MMTNDYRHSAQSYALRGITGTDSIAFHSIASRIAELRLAGRALDFGCGSGRSTRFLKSLGLDTVGCDVSVDMISQAQKQDSGGIYCVYPREGQIPFDRASFDLVFSSWVVLELGSRSDLDRYLCEAARVLRPAGKAFVVANTAEFYQHRWVSCEVDFPENTPPLRSGQLVKARLQPEGVIVTDVFWSDADYRSAFADSGLVVVRTESPKAQLSETNWLDETAVAPWIIYELEKAR